MNLKQILVAEQLGGRAIRAVRPFLERGPDKDALDRAEFILAEARHFAVCWDDLRQREDDLSNNADESTKFRQALILRLSTSLAPDRL